MNNPLQERDFSGSQAFSGFDLRQPAWQAQTCQWLAGIFAFPPSTGDIWAYRKGPARAWLEAMGHTDQLAPGTNEMRDVLDSAVSDHDLSARLGIAHARLFVGVGGPKTIAPYESAHTGTGRLFQAPAAEMAELLRRHGVHVAAAYAEAPDHLGVELALLAHLIATGHPDHTAMVLRLRRWVPGFAALCIARDATGFWAGAARTLTACLAVAAPAAAAATVHGND